MTEVCDDTALPPAEEMETPRLLLRPATLADAPETQLLFPQWDVVRFLDAQVPWPFPDNGARVFLEKRALPAMAERREWHWSLRLKGAAGSPMIGAINLSLEEDSNRGFWLGVPWRGRGYMTEACTVVTDFWFERLGQPVLRVPKAVGNTGSRRLSERMGMRLVGLAEADHVCGRLMSELWEITAEEWRQWRDAQMAASVSA